MLPRHPLRLRVLTALVGLSACVDEDGDGTIAARDCNDADPTVSPKQVEICNGRDDDCDGLIDEDVAIVAYQDRDGDGFGDPERARRVCVLPPDGVEVGGDCQDADPLAFPGAEERCNEVDDDCDGEVDEGVLTTWQRDADGDGRADPAGETVEACAPPPGFAPMIPDCDDADPAAWTGREEICDGLDNDCDGEVDEGLEDVALYVDADQDGWGVGPARVGACGDAIPGVAARRGDCDDTQGAISPDAAEVAGNGTDDDCDGRTDETELPVGTSAAAVVAAAAALGPGEVIQLAGGSWSVNLELPEGFQGVLAGEGCGRTVLIGAATAGAPTVAMTSGGLEDLTITGGTLGGLAVAGGATVRRVCVEGNSHPDDGGGVRVLGAAHLEDTLITDNVAIDKGGGLLVKVLPEGERFTADRIHVRGNTAFNLGGGAAVFGSSTFRASTFAGNVATWRAGGLAVWQGSGTPDVVIEHATFVGNVTTTDATDPYQSAREGTALFVAYPGSLTASHVLIAHEARDEVPVVVQADAGFDASAIGLWDVGDPEIGWYGRTGGSFVPTFSWFDDAIRGPARFVGYDPAEHPAGWDLRLMPDSAFVQAGDASTSGQIEDLGAYAGPAAPADGEAFRFEDLDGDGLIDAWETWHRLATWRDDADEDVDADGLDAAGELAASTDPRDPDGDGDGVLDGAEVAAGADPHNPSDHDPVPILQVPSGVVLGDTVTLDGTWSFDPDGDVLAVSWTLTGPGVATPSPATGLTPAFTPDVAGEWQLTLTVSDGRVQRSAVAMLRVVDGPTVSDTDPLSGFADGSAGSEITVPQGTWSDTTVDVAAPGLRLVGVSGDRETAIVRGAGTAPVLSIGANTEVEIEGLTLEHGGGGHGGVIDCHGCDPAEAGCNGPSRIWLRNAVVRDGGVTGNGGVIHLDHCLLIAEDSVIAEGSAGGYGGLIRGAAASVTLYRSTLADGTAVDGGGLVFLDGDGALEAWSSVFVDGRATGGLGEGLLLRPHWGYNDPSRLQQCVFADHGTSGFLVAVDDSAVLVEDSVFLANQALGGAFVVGEGARWVVGSVLEGDVGAPDLTDAFLMRSDDLDHTNDLWSWRPGSPLVDRGRGDRTDRDGTVRGVGPCAGLHADPRCRLDAVDLDQDGMSDGWEMRFGLDRTVDDGALDLDGDGTTNLDAFLQGIAP